jgi:hypothetical protein
VSHALTLAPSTYCDRNGVVNTSRGQNEISGSFSPREQRPVRRAKFDAVSRLMRGPFPRGETTMTSLFATRGMERYRRWFATRSDRSVEHSQNARLFVVVLLSRPATKTKRVSQVASAPGLYQ